MSAGTCVRGTRFRGQRLLWLCQVIMIVVPGGMSTPDDVTTWTSTTSWTELPLNEVLLPHEPNQFVATCWTSWTSRVHGTTHCGVQGV